MRLLSPLIATALLTLAARASADDIVLKRADAPIREVTVYGHEALIARSADVDATAAGPLRVVISRLPALVRDDSVRVRAGKGLTLKGSRVTSRPVTTSSQPEVERLRAEVRRLESARRDAQDAGEIAKHTQTYIEHFQTARADEASKGVAAVDLDKLSSQIEWAEKALARSLAAQKGADEKKADLEKQLAAAQAQLAQVEHASGLEKDVEVELDAAAAGHFQLAVQYVTDGASWTPAYDLRADQDAKQVEVTCLGEVTQQSGEDWQGVRLALSSARPELGARPPDLQAWLVGEYAAYSSSGSGRAYDRRLGAAETPAAPQPTESLMSKFDSTTVAPVAPEQRGATVAFVLLGAPETIPSDGKAKKTTIARKVLDAESRYFTVPKLTPFAYLRATVKNGFDFPLLAGEASVFFGPDYVGKAHVDLTPQSEKLECFLGVDERVHVERKLIKRFRDTTGIISTDVRERFEYQIAIKNSREVAVDVTILDQLPVSQNDSVKVEDVALTPAPDKDPKTEASGERRWSVHVGAKKEESIAIGFTIKFPEKEEPRVFGVEK